MKDILKKAIIPIFLSIICGGICGRMVYKIYLGDSEMSLSGNVIYLVQNGAYSSYDNMKINTVGYNYVYFEEDNLYKTVIGVTKNKNNIEKIKNFYSGDVVINEYYIDNIELNNKLNEYDDILLKETNEDNIKNIIVEMLNLYKDDKSTKLIKIS